MSNPHGLNAPHPATARHPSSTDTADSTAPVPETERRAVLLANVQDHAVERNLFADAGGAPRGPDGMPDPSAVDAAMERVARAAQALRDARREALAAAIPDDEIQAAYAVGSMGIRSSDNTAAIARLAVERDRAVFDTEVRNVDHERALRTADIDRSQRIAAGRQVDALREQLARLHQARGTSVNEIFDRWQAETETTVSQHFRSQPDTPTAGDRVSADNGPTRTVYTAAIEVTQPGASAPVRWRSGGDLSSEAQTAQWVRDQLRMLGCDLAAHVRITAHASDPDRTVPLIESAGYPHIVDDDTDRWYRQLTDIQPMDTPLTDLPGTALRVEAAAEPSAAQLLTASFAESEAEPASWINDNGVIAAAPEQLTQAAPSAEPEPGQ